MVYSSSFFLFFFCWEKQWFILVFCHLSVEHIVYNIYILYLVGHCFSWFDNDFPINSQEQLDLTLFSFKKLFSCDVLFMFVFLNKQKKKNKEKKRNICECYQLSCFLKRYTEGNNMPNDLKYKNGRKPFKSWFHEFSCPEIPNDQRKKLSIKAVWS